MSLACTVMVLPDSESLSCLSPLARYSFAVPVRLVSSLIFPDMSAVNVSLVSPDGLRGGGILRDVMYMFGSGLELRRFCWLDGDPPIWLSAR
jgi:hypothetical protein